MDIKRIIIKILLIIGIAVCSICVLIGLLLIINGENDGGIFVTCLGVIGVLIMIVLCKERGVFNVPIGDARKVSQTWQDKAQPFYAETAYSPILSTPQNANKGLVYYNQASDAVATGATNYIVIDVETTGLNCNTDRIIEIAAAKCVNDTIIDSFQSLVNPREPIPERITQLTGIRQSDVIRAPDMNSLAPKLVGFIGGLPCVAHNATFDMGFIASELRRAGVNARLEYIDTLELSQAAFPNFPNHKLNTLITSLGLLDHEQEHRAGSDVKATQRLYVLCKKELAERQRIIEKEKKKEARFERGYNLCQLGMDYEKNGDIEKAIYFYELCAVERFEGSHPYTRLAILYRKQKRYEDEIRVCDLAIDILSGTPYSEKKVEDFKHRKELAEGKTKNVP